VLIGKDFVTICRIFPALFTLVQAAAALLSPAQKR
jgi:hypothetical protein